MSQSPAPFDGAFSGRQLGEHQGDLPEHGRTSLTKSESIAHDYVLCLTATLRELSAGNHYPAVDIRRSVACEARRHRELFKAASYLQKSEICLNLRISCQIQPNVQNAVPASLPDYHTVYWCNSF